MVWFQVYYEEPSLDKALNMKTVASSSEDAECDQLQQQVMHQFLPQDYDPRSCRSILSEEEKKEMMLFNTRRIIEAFGRAQVHPLQPKTIDQNVICQQVADNTIKSTIFQNNTHVIRYSDNNKNNNYNWP